MDERVLLVDRLEELHPNLNFTAILPLMILRIAHVPVSRAAGTRRRPISVSHRGVPGEWEDRWDDTPACSGSLLRRRQTTFGEGTITEFAAVGVAALLMHALEGMELQGVLPVGSGGD